MSLDLALTASEVVRLLAMGKNINLVVLLLTLISTGSPQTTSTNTSRFQSRTTTQTTRFFKAEGGVSAEYLRLAKDGTYRVISREHMFVALTEEGWWEQKGSAITFKRKTLMRGGELTDARGTSYEGTEVEYKGKTFIVWGAEGCPGIVIPIEETKQQLDGDPKSLPEYVFFKTTAKIYAQETKQLYPFRYLRPGDVR